MVWMSRGEEERLGGLEAEGQPREEMVQQSGPLGGEGRRNTSGQNGGSVAFCLGGGILVGEPPLHMPLAGIWH